MHEDRKVVNQAVAFLSQHPSAGTQLTFADTFRWIGIVLARSHFLNKPRESERFLFNKYSAFEADLVLQLTEVLDGQAVFLKWLNTSVHKNYRKLNQCTAVHVCSAEETRGGTREGDDEQKNLWKIHAQFSPRRWSCWGGSNVSLKRARLNYRSWSVTAAESILAVAWFVMLGMCMYPVHCFRWWEMDQRDCSRSPARLVGTGERDWALLNIVE